MDPALRRSPGMSAPLRRCRAQSECVYPRREAFKRVLSPRPCPAIHPFVLLAFIVADLLLQASGTLTPHYGTRLSTAARVWRRLPRLDRWAADRFVEHTRHPGGEGGGAEAIDDALRRLVWIEGHRPVCDGADRLSQRLRVTGLDQKRGTLIEALPGAFVADHLGLVEADHRLSQGVIVRIAAAADRGLDAGFLEALGV